MGEGNTIINNFNEMLKKHPQAMRRALEEIFLEDKQHQEKEDQYCASIGAVSINEIMKERRQKDAN